VLQSKGLVQMEELDMGLTPEQLDQFIYGEREHITPLFRRPSNFFQKLKFSRYIPARSASSF
jgi:hypothetical protein